jgi:hypothetical protein
MAEFFIREEFDPTVRTVVNEPGSRLRHGREVTGRREDRRAGGCSELRGEEGQEPLVKGFDGRLFSFKNELGLAEDFKGRCLQEDASFLVFDPLDVSNCLGYHVVALKNEASTGV